MTKIIFAICSLFFTFSTFSQSSVTGELRKWHTVTIFFDGPNTSENNNINPFLQYRLNVDFTGPNGESFTVPGFYAADGNAAETSATSGNKWAVRFTPNQTGNWSYTASFRTGTNIAVSLVENDGSATSFDGENGNFSISSTNKPKPDNRANGRLSYVGERYLQYEETNEYFLKAGSDSPENLLAFSDFDNTINSKDWSPHIGDWKNGDPVWKSNRGRALIGAINYLSERGMNAFSFLTMNINGDGRDVWPFIATSNNALNASSGTASQNRTKYDVSKLEQWEILFSHADSKGMYLHFKTQETENDQLLDGGDLGIQRKLYYRELIARFGHHLSLNWNLGEEHDLYDDLDDIENTLVKSYATFIESLDPYNHNIVIHSRPRTNEQNSLFQPLLGSNSELTGASLQLQIADIHNDVKRWVLASENTGKPWVVANDEQGLSTRGVTVDANYNGNRGSQPDNRTDTRHQVLWGTLMAGGAGVEYYFGSQTGETDLAAEDFRSRNSKWNDAKIALDFFQNNIPFWQMDTNDGLTSDSDDYCFAKEDEVYLIYLPNGGSTNLNLSSVNGSFSVKWFNPSSGGNLSNGTIREIQGGANRSIGNPPNNTSSDWVVLVTKTADDDPVDPPSGDCDYDYEEIDGLVLIEAENLNTPSGWQEDTSNTGFTGDGYLNWQGGNNFNTPGNGLISTSIRINTPGTYLFQWRNTIGAGNSTTDNNDNWLRFPDADDFFAERGSSVIFPGGSGKTPNPEGASSNGWFKVYANSLSWTWSTNTSDRDPHSIYVTFNTAGTYTMEISGRSNNHLIDRIALSQDFNNPTNLSLAETSCSGDSSRVAVTSVSINPQTASVEVGDTVDIDAIVSPSNATDNGVNWSSSNTAIATVNINGLVTARNEGIVTITATTQDGGFSSSSTVTVTPEDSSEIAVTGIRVAPERINLDTNVTRTLTYSITPSNATNTTIFWSSSNQGIATVNQNGVVTTIDEGQVEIEARTQDGGFTSFAIITVTSTNSGNIPVAGIRVSPQQIVLDQGETTVADALVRPTNASNKNITWSSSDPTIATVDENGLITALNEGMVDIAATTEDGGFTSDATVRIIATEPDDVNVSVTGIVVSPNNITLEDGDTFVFAHNINPTNATNKNVTWSSSNVTIASVNQNGLVTARREGSVLISVTTQDGNFTSTANVTVTLPESGSIPVTRIFVQPQQVSLQGGETIVLSFQITPSNATNTNVVWTSTDETIAIVNQNGLVTALREGTAKIAVTTEDGGFLSDATVKVTSTSSDMVSVTGVTVAPENLVLEEGDTTTLEHSISPSNATNQNITWSSSNAAIATVNQNGFVTAIAEGSVVITVTTQDGNFTSDSSIQVTSASPDTILVSGVMVTPTNLVLEEGDTTTLEHSISPSNATNQNITWSSSDATIVTVNQNGFVTAITEGSVVITVTTQDGNFSAVSNVEVSISDAINIPVIGIEITPEELSLEILDTTQLSATISPSNATNTAVIWSTDDALIATVNDNGLVTAVEEGTVTITATSVDGNFIATVLVEVVSIVGIDEDIEELAILYPNPTLDSVEIINVYQEEGGFVGLYTMSGSLLIEKQINKDEIITISLASLSSGNYVVVINNMQEVISRKVIKL